jgi:hypothetical protein
MQVLLDLMIYNQNNPQMLANIIQNIFRVDLFERFTFSQTTENTKKAYLSIISKITNYFESLGSYYSTFPKELQRNLRRIQKWQFSQSQEIYQICFTLIQGVQSRKLAFESRAVGFENN